MKWLSPLRAKVGVGFILVLLAVLALFYQESIHHSFRSHFMENKAYQARLHFGEAPPEIFRLAERIEWGDAITSDEAAAAGEYLDARFGDGVTLLLHAAYRKNLEAIDGLLGAGADPYVQSQSSWNATYTFPEHIGRSMEHEFSTEAIKLYLKHGGDPNFRFFDNYKTPTIQRMAILGNYEGLKELLEAGADPWGTDTRGSSAMRSLARKHDVYDFLNQLVDEGYLDKRKEAEIDVFFTSLTGYAQRGDEISLAIKALAKRIIKRYPQLKDHRNLSRVFKDHWKDETWTVPWDEINSEAVR